MKELIRIAKYAYCTGCSDDECKSCPRGRAITRAEEREKLVEAVIETALAEAKILHPHGIPFKCDHPMCDVLFALKAFDSQESKP